MLRTNDNWERLVAAVLKKQELWELFHAQSRSPSNCSEESDYSSSSSSSYRFHDVAFDISSRWGDEFAVSQDSFTKLVFVSDFSPAFDVEYVAVSSSEILGTGTFGSAYKVVMSNGVTIVVKAVRAVGIQELEFKRNMEVIGNVMHENVLALRAYFYSAGQRLMLYDHISKGSVYSLLHGQTGVHRAEIDWKTRLKIAVGAAKGLAEIHAQNGGTLVHGNIKASNTFLNSRYDGLISDLGLATMISTNVKRPAWCYAPEVKNTREVSQASDVYSFGILLLELLTRKSPVHVPGGPRAVDLVKFVTSIRRKFWASKVYDVDLLNQTDIREQMVKMLQIGIGCVAKSLKQRPKMSEVVRMLEDICIQNKPATPSSSSPLAPSSLQKDLVFFKGNNFQMFDLEDLLRASAEVLGKGTFGTSYLARLETGNTVHVKRIKDVTAGTKEFQQHMELVGRIRYVNVVELIAYYYSKDETLLVYDYYNHGSVSKLLHGLSGVDRAEIDWETRLGIAVGAARGLAEIHAQNGGTLVHGNIKASNIFLNSQHYGLISDIGLATMISTNVKRPAWCYAPEVKNTRDVSQASDVYSFGILLLELLTRKSPVHVPGGPRAVDLVRFVTFTSKVYDVDLLKQADKKEQMVKMLQIGIGCVAKSLKQRPKMSEVVRMLEDISIANKPTAPSSSSPLAPTSLQKDLVFFQGNNFQTFDLEDLLRASAKVLGKGTFGTCYKAILETGNTVAVKRIKDVTAGSEEFRQQMELIGRIRHENIAELRAYYYSEDEKLMVYDYYDEGSVSKLLHGSTLSSDQPLDLDTRLRIAVGAARGIAHIHTQASGTLVHGNVKSSNLFIKGHRYGLISDTGLAKLTSPIQVTGLRTLGYNTPEIDSTSKLSQASDVYSFGVVLLELLTGKAPPNPIKIGDDVSVVNWVQSVTGQDDWTSEIFDSELLRAGCNEETLMQLMQIAKDCVATAPEQRNKMPQVVNMLKEVSKFHTLDQPSPGSRLESILPTFMP